MGIQIKVGKFEATLPAVHTLPVREAMRIMQAEPQEQPFIMSQVIMSRLTWLQRKKFESLSMEQYSQVLHEWLGIKEEK